MGLYNYCTECMNTLQWKFNTLLRWCLINQENNVQRPLAKQAMYDCAMQVGAGDASSKFESPISTAMPTLGQIVIGT